MAQALEVPGIISLAAGFVDQSSLPHEQVEEGITHIMDAVDDLQSPLQYSSTAGDFELRNILLERFKIDGCIPSHQTLNESNIMLGSGSQQVLYLAFEALLNEGDIVLMEAPTYFVVLGAMAARGAETVGISTDEHGLIPHELRQTLEGLEHNGKLSRVKMLYLMSYATNPQGIQLSLDRRKQIFDILTSYKKKGYPILLLEDAAYRKLSLEHCGMPPIYSMQEEDELVLFTESFSKSLSPGLRMGYGIGPKSIIQKMVDLKGNHDFGSSNLSMQIVKRLLHTGVFETHVQKLKSVYQAKWEIVNQVLSETMPPNTTWIQPTGGFYTWVTLPPEINTNGDSAFFHAAIEEKVLYVPGNLCYSNDRNESQQTSSLRLAYGMINEERLREGCQRLGRAVAKVVEPCGV
jgi:2-aminoadipate transaminase